MSYAIITLGGKQYRVREGERLLVDQLKTDEGKTFEPRVLLIGGDGNTDLSPTATVTARVVGHQLGEKIRIGKYKKRTGYRKHNGYRSRLTQIEIESIGGTAKKAAPAKKAEAPQAEAPAAAQAEAPTAPKAAQSEPAPKAAQSEPEPKAEPAPKAEAASTVAPATPKAETAAAEAPARTAHPPKDYDDLTVAQIAEAASGWRRPNLEAALEHERANANRKGAIAALESALAAKEDHS
jgi:large subunit ribosomal protein L21